MSIFSNQTERDLAKHPSKPVPEEGKYYDCYHGSGFIHDIRECNVCPFNAKCSWYADMEMRGVLIK